jgi:nitrous oxidase accessory protein NosD
MKTLSETRLVAAFAILPLGLGATTSAMGADLYVPADYPTIQAAVDAAQANDTIHIAPGVYSGQVNIVSKTLTLIGQPGTILRATTNMTGHTGSVNIPILEIGSSQVTVRGLTFEGDRLAERYVGDGDLLGIYFRNSSGNVENCTFYGFRESTPGPEGAIAIFAYALDDVPAATVRVVGSTFADNYAGIVLRGSSTRQNVNGTVENNIIIGPGPLPLTGVDTCGGVEIEEGVGGRIAGNTISGFSYVGTAADFPISFGILAVNEANFPPDFGIVEPLLIEGNTFSDNQFHIALVKGDNSVVRNNRLQGTAPGIRPVGLGVSGTNVTIANNQFEDMPEGIQLWGNDPDYGTILGAAVNAQVTSNRFCNVTNRINVEPLASATQVGTLLCPFPPPTLAIANAVMLSWPNDSDGWTLESAPDPLGPWTPLYVTPSVQDGQYVSAVKTGGQLRFFRLRQ